MDTKENIVVGSGVTVVGAEVPSSYQGAPRKDAPPQSSVAPTEGVNPLGVSMPGLFEKKKKGRPRKSGPDGVMQKVSSPMPVSSSAPPTVGGYPSVKRGRGRGAASVAKQQARASKSEAFDGVNFTPHVITVDVGEDITEKIISFCQQGPRAISIVSANGMVSNATLRQAGSSGGKLTYEGYFEIVNLCGSFTPTEEGTRYRAGGLCVSLSSPNGQVVGGCVAGLLIAATPIQIIVGSFLPHIPPELKRKKHRKQQSATTPFTITVAAPPTASEADKEASGAQRHNNSAVQIQSINPAPMSYHRENWPSTQQPMQERKTTTTDINISLPSGVK